MIATYSSSISPERDVKDLSAPSAKDNTRGLTNSETSLNVVVIPLCFPVQSKSDEVGFGWVCFEEVVEQTPA